MPRPSFLHLAVLALGLACAVVLLWIWREGRRPAGNPEVATATTKAGASSVATPASTAPRLALAPLLEALRRALARGDARADEAVLTFKDAAALQRFLQRAAAAGLTVTGRVDALRTVRVRFDTLEALARDLTASAADLAALSANTHFTVPPPPAREARPDLDQVPFRNETLAYLGATGDRSAWGRGVLIAILDTGVAPDATFGRTRLQFLDLGLGVAPGQAEGDGHGTGVAALAAGASPDAAGVAPGAGLLSVRVTDASGVSDLFTISQAIVAAADAGARVINVSLGGYATGAVLDAALAYAGQRGAIVVAAAGNDQAAQLAWPAADPRVLSVGAIDRAEQQVTFSNSSASLQLTAPGYGVQTAWLDQQRALVDGTSASAPLVAGALAAVLSQNPALTTQQAADLLRSAASDGGAPGADAAYGQGILNVGWAMNRSNPAYVDTAVSTHAYNADTNQMEFVVQNRSGRAVSGLILAVTAGTTTAQQAVPSLSPGESYVARAPVSESLRATGNLTFTTQLNNPLGVTDQVPANNRRTSTLVAPQP
jgi:hypothetical protein